MVSTILIVAILAGVIADRRNAKRQPPK